MFFKTKFHIDFVKHSPLELPAICKSKRECTDEIETKIKGNLVNGQKAVVLHSFYCIYMCVCVHVCVHARVCVLVCIYVCVYMCMCGVYVHMHECMCTRVCMCVYLFHNTLR